MSLPPNRLARLREAQDLSQADIASRLGKKTERTVRRWEEGETAIPDNDKLALADLFGVTVAWLMNWPGENGNGGEGEREAA